MKKTKLLKKQTCFISLFYSIIILHDRLGFFCSPRECKPRISLIAHATEKFFLCLLNFLHVYDMQAGYLV